MASICIDFFLKYRGISIGQKLGIGIGIGLNFGIVTSLVGALSQGTSKVYIVGVGIVTGYSRPLRIQWKGLHEYYTMETQKGRIFFFFRKV